MTYRAPLDEIFFAMRMAAAAAESADLRPELGDGTAASVIREAAKFAEERLAPLNAVGDRIGARLENGRVTTPPGWREAHQIWRDGGWAGLAAPTRFGGAGLPRLLASACLEMWQGANMAFMLGPLLSFAAVDALVAHGGPTLQKLFLEKIVAGQWTATMNLTEPQAGSDLSDVRARAVPTGDGRYRLFGQKIFITYGDHDLAENIVHMVLARLPDAPAGTRGLSLFLAPKFTVDGTGALGGRNDLRCSSLEHKLGIHGAPTCTMIFGEGEGAEAWLVGEPNRGVACMFAMMNNARLAVGLQGVGLCEAATGAALAYARERRQGRALGAPQALQTEIIAHPDVRRMLMTMKAATAVSRALCYLTAAATDVSECDGPQRQAAAERAALLTPVAKAFSTDLANETTSLCVQVHGGMGYVEETGVAQLMRDARIAAIYEGTNGIQAIDLVQRKLPVGGGAAMRRELAAMRASLAALEAADAPALGATVAQLGDSLECLGRATEWMLSTMERGGEAAALAGASPYLRLFGLVRGGASLAESALASHLSVAGGDDDPAHAGRLALARFFAENLAPAARAHETAVTIGAPSVLGADAALRERP
jgi:acyl-CoA dehydrogenase